MRNLYFLWNKFLITSLSRQFHTGISLGARPGRKNRVQFKSKKQFEKSLAENYEHDENAGAEEEESEDFNFMEAHEAYDEFIREEKKEGQKLGNILTAKKFFEPEKQPQMLTHAERNCIKYLHEKDPVHWDVETLSNSFPATTDIIKKIIKSKYKRSPEEQKALDRKVQKNWELLAKGTLDADPAFVEHLKKFINRRHAILNQLSNGDLYLPEEKTKKVWNMGEMSSILSKYEKSVNLLAKAQDRESKSMLPVSGEEINPADADEEKSSLEVMHEKITKVATIRNIEGAESFLLKKFINRSKEKLTLEELEQSVLDKSDSDMILSLEEKAILESRLGKESPKTTIKPASPTEQKHTKFLKTLVGNTNTSSALESSSCENTVKNTPKQKIYTRRSEKFLPENEIKYVAPEPDENTVFVEDYKLGTKLNREQLNLNSEKESNLPVGKKTERKNRVLDPEAQERQKLFFEKEVQDIKSTAFWDGRMGSKDKALIETMKEPLGPFEEYEKATETDVYVENDFPKRIKIPKSQIGSGLTFKVKDCYYDDDGEFLYRVPGMTK